MPSQSKPRPVDALFGDDSGPALPNYIVEPAQPPSTVSPPPPDPTPLGVPIQSSVPAPTVMPALPTFEQEPPASEPLVTSPIRLRLDDDNPMTKLGERIDRLYGEVKMDLIDSKTATEYCFGLLLQARQALESRDYARAEFYIQTVDAKLKRSQKSMKAAFGFGVILLTLWELIALGIGGSLLVLTYVMNLTLFGLPVMPELLVLLRAVGWGIVGGVIGAFFNLPWFIQFREYDPAYAMNYFTRPFVGALVGAVLFLISGAGILAGSLVVGDVKVGPVFLYVFSALAGFKQEYVGEFLDGVMRAMLRPPQVPNGLKPPQPK